MVTLTTVFGSHEGIKQLIARWAKVEDIAMAQPFQSETRRQDFLLARSALRALLAQATGASDWNIRPDALGKPYVFTASGTPGPHISLSHTNGLIACAVSDDAPIGIDVEYWRERDFMALADYAFGPHERAEVASGGAGAFYRIWTLREAIAKATGQGVMAGFNGQDYIAGGPENGCWRANNWGLFYYSPKANYSLAVASKDSSILPQVVDLNSH